MTVKYQCPECQAVLKPTKPIPAGKKIRCPKCNNLFAPTAAEQLSAAASRAMQDDDDDGEQMYRFAEADQPAAPAPKKGRASIYEEEIKGRFPMSKRRPAQVICTQPSTALLAAAMITCVGALCLIVYYLFPIIFSGKPENVGYRWLMIVLYALVFVYGGLVVNGAYNMSQVESFRWAVAGSIMAMIPVTMWFYLLMLPAGIWCFVTLRKPEVQAGFFEKPEENH